MGRYYQGDIEGKFWSGVQVSTVAERFGCTELEPSEIKYFISEDDKHLIINELLIIEAKLGENIKKFDDFFNEHNGYNNDMIKKAGLDKDLLEDYADYKFGKQLLDYVEEHGDCYFTAEIY